MIFYGKTFAEKQRDQKGAHYDADTRKLKAENAKLEEIIADRFEIKMKMAEEISKLRATLEWLRSYVSGHTVYGLPHALEKIDAALNMEDGEGNPLYQASTGEK